MRKKTFFLLLNIFSLTFIFLLGVGLRAQESISGNFLFLLDQGRDMIAVKNILYDHHLTLIGPYTSLQGVFQGPLWYYLLLLPTFIFNGDPWGGVLLMLVISIATLILVYIWVKKLFGKSIAVFALFLFAVSPEAVAAATYVWNPHPMWFLVVIYVLSLYEVFGLRNKKYNFILWPSISLMFHFQTALAVFILGATLIFVLLFNAKSVRNKHFYYGLGIAFIFFVPQILFDFRHNFLMTKSILNIFLGNDRGLFVGGENRDYLDLIKSNMSLFYYNFSTTFVREGIFKEFPKIALIIIALILIFYKKLNFFKKEKHFIAISASIIGIIAIFSFLYPFPMRYWFMTGFQGIYIILFAIILNQIGKWKIGKVALIIYVAFILLYSGEKLYKLYINPPNDGGAEKIKGKLAAINYIYNDAGNKSFGILVFTPAVLTDAYDYLIWWHGGRKYNYIPHKDKKGIFYLLIEKDRAKPWSYNGWLETVIKTGNILKTWTLPTGLIIQKRGV